MPRCDVVVVGAGLAGLCCADVLAGAGCDVVVLEARDRVGGRTFSRRDGFADGQVAESGAEYLDAHHTELLALVARFALPLLPGRVSDDPTRTLLDHGGRLASITSADQATGGRVGSDLRRFEDAVRTVAELVDLEDPTAGPFADDLDRRPVSSFLADLELAPLAWLVVGRELRCEMGVPPGELSLLHLAWSSGITLSGGERANHAHRIGGGAQSVAEALATHLGARVRLSSPVSAVRASGTGPSGVRVEVAGTAEVLVAGAVVLAVPVPVLSRLEVDLPLPTELLALPYGQGGKVSIQYDRRLWLDQGCDGTVLSDRPYGKVWEATNGRPGDHGVLTVLLTSHDGASFVALPHAADRVAAEVNRCFPGASGFAGHRVVHDWTNDRWSLGTYAAFGPGQVSTLWPLLRTPVFGPVVLAGEHTDRFQGWMEGAVRSGLRAATDVLAL